MSPLTIYQDSISKVTTVSNYFIDEYMPNANAAQIKIYLYLLRQIGEGLPTSICEMADFLNYPEKDVIRALKYWEKQHVLALDSDTAGQLTGIHMLPLSQGYKMEAVPKAAVISEPEPKAVAEPVIADAAVVSTEIEKPEYSLDDIKEFKENDDAAELLFIVESYLRRPLSVSDLHSIYFFMETLKMSVDLVDYLFQYCIERGKTDFHYIEKVAINWAENGIKSPSEAKDFSYKYAKIVYTVMKALGKSTVPTEEETSYVQTWTNDMGFTDDIILEACKRSVRGTDKGRLQYADKILKEWKKSKVITLTDIDKLDLKFKENKNTASASRANYKKSSFHQFEHRNYNFDALEQQLLSN